MMIKLWVFRILEW